MEREVFESIKREVREVQSPYFEDEDIEYYYNKNNGDVNATIHELLMVKSEDSSISVSGLTTQDTSSYFRRLAARYRSYNSGVLPDGQHQV